MYLACKDSFGMQEAPESQDTQGSRISRIGGFIGKEFREALPATIFFLVLFHMIGLTKAVVLDDYSFTALRSAGSVIAALIVAKAILVVEALPVAGLFSNRPLLKILWKTLLYGVVALIFRFIEELIPLLSKYGGLVSAIKAMPAEICWGLFIVMALWILGGLFLYCLASELIRVIGPDNVRQALISGVEAQAGPDCRA